MVRIAVELSAPALATTQVLHTLRWLASPTRVQAGCLDCRVWTDDDESVVRYVEEWETEEAMRERVRSTRFTQLLELLESATVQPSVQFEFVTRTRGLDYVEEVRNLDRPDVVSLREAAPLHPVATRPRRGC